ncbi:hypothetical protein PR001_g14607 [Phytophthora rubi]|uniref:Uncharacterized protein n=1 Tax=Phytophthora rubi TaxID=129364 RepID=A0A6A3KMG0_9STRA|nr:hypothetical protein PR002_g16526 [Phytophthora rubi]KAE9016621.1 hypothetical protein PR001_g14607 [Phytophthora rubi]
MLGLGIFQSRATSTGSVGMGISALTISSMGLSGMVVSGVFASGVDVSVTGGTVIIVSDVDDSGVRVLEGETVRGRQEILSNPKLRPNGITSSSPNSTLLLVQ